MTERWRLVSSGSLRTPFIIENEGETIAQIIWSEHNEGDTEEHALLIAAAPDLLSACEAALNDRMYNEWPNVADLLKAAISKARGTRN